MKRTLSKFLLGSILAIPITLGLTSPNMVEAAGGTGTISNPFIIETPAEFINIQSSPSSHYKLANDLDFQSTAFNGLGQNLNNWFTGSLDGNNKTIKNMNISNPTSTYVGIFGSGYRPTSAYAGVKDLILENIQVEGRQRTGVLFGNTNSYSSSNTLRFELSNITVNNSTVFSSNNGTTGQYNGGLIGYATYTSLTNISSDVDVEIKSYTASTHQYIGGIAGAFVTGEMTNVNSYGNILPWTGNIIRSNAYYIGGISGTSSGSSYSNLTNQGTLNLGGNSSYPTQTVQQIGGIMGNSSSDTFTSLYNYGDINLDYGYFYSIGGLFGYSYVNNLSYGSNSGDINITRYYNAYKIGGVTGDHNAYPQYYYSTNEGNISITLPSNTTNVYAVGGFIGHFQNWSGSTNMNIQYNSSEGDIFISASGNVYQIGGFMGYGYFYTHTNEYMTDNFSSGKMTISSASDFYQSGGFIGSTTWGTTSGNASVLRNYTDTELIFVKNSTSSQYPSGFTGYLITGGSNNLALNKNIVPSGAFSATNYFYKNYHSWNGTNAGNVYLDTIPGTVSANWNSITATQAKAWATYSGKGFSSTYWAIQEGTGYPYLKHIQPLVTALSAPTNGASYQQSTINLSWVAPKTNAPITYRVNIEKMESGQTTWSNVGTYTSNTATYAFNVPFGTPGNTKFRWKVASASILGSISPYTSEVREFTFSNNVPTIAATYTASQKDLAVSLNKRTMAFTVSSVVDPDSFNYVKLNAEIVGISGSKKQLGTNLTGPVSWTSKNYKLKLVPNFSPSGSTFNILVVDAANENTVIATLVTGRAMQAANAPAAESFTLKLYAEDYQNSNNSLLSTSTASQQAITIDTRNYLPRVFNTNHDVNGRVMSANQGFNKIKFSGSIDDLDPSDGMTVYYAVKLASDKVAGNYVVNPASDTVIKTIPANVAGTGTTDTFSGTYTVTESLVNGDYVLLVYGKDTQSGTGTPIVIPFTISKTNPDIRFYANYGGTIIATPERHIQAKDSKLKMYFSAYDYTTFEYAGYVVRANQQTSSGSYEDLKIRGAYTNDVTSQFIGVDLADVTFNKGDMIVFKFRAISSTGVKVEKDVRVLIGDQNSTLTSIGDTKVPTPLLITP